MKVEMFLTIDNDEEVTEERPPENKKRKYSRKNSDLFEFHQTIDYFPLVTFL